MWQDKAAVSWWFRQTSDEDVDVEDESQELSIRARLPIPKDAFSRWISQPLQENDDA